MDAFFTTLTLSFTPQIVFAMLGGLLGSLIASDRDRYGWQLSLMFCIAALSFAGAMGEYLHLSRGIESIFWLFVLNVPLGMTVGSTLDVLRIASPPLIERLVKAIANSGVSIIVESVLGKLARWFGVDVSVYKDSNGFMDFDEANREKEKEEEEGIEEDVDEETDLDSR